MNDFRPGDRLCHCTLIDRCGAGSYGEVYLAEDEIGARVAIKIVPNGGRYSEREIAGLRHYRDCNHPNLLKIRHIEITPEYVIYTMDAADDLHRGQGKYLPDTLANRLRLRKRLDGTEIETMLAGILPGLEELHGKNLVHRDIKPDNILYVNGRPTLADAGLIVPAGQGSLVGTPGFLSPRLLAGKARAETQDDFYALGKVIYCALTGNPVEEYPSLPRDMTLSGNADWGKIFRTMCEGTIASAAEFRDFLQSVRLGTVSFHRKRRIVKWLIAATAVLLTMAAVAFFVFRREETAAGSIPVSKLPGNGPVIRRIDRTPPETEKKWNDGAFSVLQALREGGFYDTDKSRQLDLTRPISKDEFFKRLLRCSETPRMRLLVCLPSLAEEKKPSALERELAEICRDYQAEAPSFDDARRQSAPDLLLWGNQLAIQRMKLAENEAMQCLALDSMIREKIDEILVAGKISEKEKEDLKTWIALRNTLIDKKSGGKTIPAKRVAPPESLQRVPLPAVPEKPAESIQKRGDTFPRPVGKREDIPKKDIPPVSDVLHDAGYFDTDKMRDLLSLRSLTNKNFISRLLFEEGIPRMVHGSKKIFRHGKVPSSLEREIADACRDYREGEMGIKSSRQYDWATEGGNPLEVQRKMLSEDTVMQGIALDLLIREKIDGILISGKISEKEKEDLKTWIALRNTLIDKKTKKIQIRRQKVNQTANNENGLRLRPERLFSNFADFSVRTEKDLLCAGNDVIL
ncbi:MAG: protein kinase [Victivallaceae bacterium]|nr:protein kinase [Victivallaceae bacterium]